MTGLPVIIPWCRRNESPKVVIGDNLSSPFSPDIIRLCEENSIRFICLAPNSTHLLQPLDIAFYGPMKRKWRIILKDWKMRNQSLSTLPKDSFPKLLKELMASLNLENLKSGFKEREYKWCLGKVSHLLTFKVAKEEAKEVEESSSSDEEDTVETDAEEIVENVDPNLKLLPYSKVKAGDWVKVMYEGEVFLGKAMEKQAGEVLVKCFIKEVIT